MFQKALWTVTFSINLFCAITAQENKWWLYSKDKPVCCRCVPFFACVDGSIDSSKLDEFKFQEDELSVNVQVCKVLNEFCCLNSTAFPICKSFGPAPEVPSVNKNPQLGVSCDCVFWEICPVDKVITDGKGHKSSPLEKMSLVTHSQCTEPLQVCCQSDTKEVRVTRTGKSVNNTRMMKCQCVEPELCPGFEPNIHGINTIEPRTGSNQQCPNENEICCEDVHDIRTTTDTKPMKQEGTSILPLFNVLCMLSISIFVFIFF